MAFAGSLFNICPLFNMTGSGKLSLRAKIRAKRRAVTEMIRLMEVNAENGVDYSGKCYIAYSDRPKDSEQIAELIEGKFKKPNGKPFINSIGAAMGSHAES